MTNINKVAEVLREHARTAAQFTPESSAQALADAGLLAPEMPSDVADLIATARKNYDDYGWQSDATLSQAVIVGWYLADALEAALNGGSND